jgi:hypothetical protein
MAPDVRPVQDLPANAFDWVMGCTLVYCFVFGIGELVLQAWVPGSFLIGAAAIAGYLIYWSLSRRGWKTLSGTDVSASEARQLLPENRRELQS